MQVIGHEKQQIELPLACPHLVANTFQDLAGARLRSELVLAPRLAIDRHKAG